jgi:ketosteroid isomerase-like protein
VAATDERLRSLQSALHAWREHIPAGQALSLPLDPARDHWTGDPEAQLTVVEYGGYANRALSGEDRELRGALAEWLAGRRLCFAFRYFPLSEFDVDAWRGARAAEAAAAQRRFWEMHATLSGEHARFDPAGLRRAARRLGLDLERFERDMYRERTTARILEDFDGALRSGANGAPTYYVCGIRQDVGGPQELRCRLQRLLDGDRDALDEAAPALRAPGHADIPRAWYEALARHELPSTLACFAEDVTWIGWHEELPGGGRAGGREALARLFARLPRTRRVHARTRTLMDADERVVVTGDLSGRAAAPAGHVTVPFVQIWEFEGGLVRRVETLADDRALARLLPARC